MLSSVRDQIAETSIFPPADLIVSDELTGQLQQLLHTASLALGRSRCCISLMNDSTDKVVNFVSSHVPAQELRRTQFELGEGIAGHVVRTSEPVRIGDVTERSEFVRLGKRRISSLICAPIVHDGDVLGCITAVSPRRRAFGKAKLELLRSFARQASTCIIENRRAEMTRGLSELLDRFVAYSSDGVLVLDSNRRVVDLNRSFETLAESERERIRGLQCHEVLKSCNCRQPSVSTDCPLLPRGRDSLSMPYAEATIVAVGGIEKRVSLQAVSTAGDRDNGSILFVRELDQFKKTDAGRLDVLAMISHELRTPLSAITASTDLILTGRMGVLKPLQREFLTSVQISAKRLRRLAEDILALYSAEVGQFKMNYEPVRLSSVVEVAIVQLGPLATEAGLTLVNDVDDNLPLVAADSRRLEQVVMNLMGNAIKFTPQGGRVVVTASNAGDEVHVCVEDSGIGIPLEEQSKVFESFYRASNGLRNTTRGVGLGLATAKLIVEQHGGRIWVESDPSRGSKFCFSLPLEAERVVVRDMFG